MRFDAPDNGGNDGDRRPSLTATSLFLVLILFWIVTRIEYVLILMLFSLLLGTILEGPVRRLEDRHFPRPAAIFAVYAAIIGLLVLLVVAIIPVVTDQADTFREDVPEQIQTLADDWRTSSNPLLSGTGADLLDRAREFLDTSDGEAVEVSSGAVQNVIPVISSITAGLVAVVSTLVVTFYYLMEKAFIRKVVLDQIDPRRRPRIDRIWQDVERKVGGWMRGQLFLCLIIGTIATVSYGVLGIRFWPLLGLWAGITEIIPIVGPWIGGVPAVIVALTQGWDKAIFVAIVIVAMQTLENWFLVPRVMRGAVGLTPLTVFLAILAGTQFLGVTGAVLAIPIAAAIQVILTDIFAARQLQREPQQQSGWRWMLNRAAREGDGMIEVVREFDDDDDLTSPGQTVSADVVPQQASAKPPPEPEAQPAAASSRRSRPGWAPFGSEAAPGQTPQQAESPATDDRDR